VLKQEATALPIDAGGGAPWTVLELSEARPGAQAKKIAKLLRLAEVLAGPTCLGRKLVALL